MLAFLTPVLQSLAAIYASDSAIGISILLICCHLLTYDYQYANKTNSNVNDIVGSPTSLNAIFMASILLASRIDSCRHVFILLFMSLNLFGFGPFIRRQVRKQSRLKYDLLGVFGVLFNFVIIFLSHHIIAFFYLFTAIFVTCGTPVVFIYAYTFKNDIRGPWDIP